MSDRRQYKRFDIIVHRPLHTLYGGMQYEFHIQVRARCWALEALVEAFLSIASSPQDKPVTHLGRDCQVPFCRLGRPKHLLWREDVISEGALAGGLPLFTGKIIWVVDVATGHLITTPHV